ncbi:phosphomannomutase/phosphoglucomutase [Jiangella asiatica]|uniref:Phosphomannomutase/phosphoglucomutase n=1 Tax=Jiangella asiatica TaxID=2530372 RepID=A0A4R5DUW2_9ACTN|nr:phosphomannomutase/phosphoglucomutase [Jiangella asiatica]TDE15941.1 phosphomannomutase/phosphoglucomutase [Jiangella asiatica]
MRDLAPILKAYDIRGVVPDQLDDDTARAIGWAAAHVLAGGRGGLVVGHDMRPTSPRLAAAFADGATAAGTDVVLAGLTSTDQLYYASGALNLPGAMFTASHNPARYNGIKLCRAGAAPVGRDTGLLEMKALIDDGVPPAPAVGARGAVEHRDTLGDYAKHLHGLVDLTGSRPLTVVVDAGNGMAGLTAPAALAVVDGLTVVQLYFELDGTFPNHEANPIDPANLVDLQAAVREHGADVGLAFDGDADRCFVVDERGEPVSPSALTALIAVRELARDPGAQVVHNLITSKAVPEIIAEHGGVPVRTRVGHSLIKQTMAETGAIFGGEHSGHFYFRDFWRADSGMLAALHTLAALGTDQQARPLSRLLAPYERYAASGEINSTVHDADAVTARVEKTFGDAADVTIDRLDGLTVEHTGAPMWWFNLRPSNTEPLLRLNVEGADRAVMERVRDDVLRVVREPGEGDA